ncbi:MAG: TM2 domain-containing protein [Clostridiales bacterium]|jgi:TM2 domain-containing membrane protein YozV|nr:TM2 domain-containing protein [Clostridiales bacterium]
MANCPQCGAAVDPSSTQCKYCGESLTPQQPQQYQQTNQMPAQQYQQQPVTNIYNQYNSTGINPAWPIKSKVVAGVLAIVLGGIGVHKFYLGKVGTGVLYLIFCWTGIPAIIGFIEGLVYLASSDHNFQVKNRVRLT